MEKQKVLSRKKPLNNSILCVSVFFAALLPASAQEISSHLWENRVLIVMTPDTINTQFREQVKQFEENVSGLRERKLVVYLATPEAYKIFNSETDNWISDGFLYKDYKRKDSAIELVLIGLDGGIKHRKYSFTPVQEIFAIIDGMPMRQSELQKSKKGNN